ncbi:hypothetical protein ACP70R_014614 [Stipagrostis hirtigluma subsp. patula]
MASSRPQPVPPLVEKPTILAPLQLRIEDIPVVEYKIEEDESYQKMMKKRFVRQGKIASLRIGPHLVPVAPFPFPRMNHEYSYHIIRMTSDSYPQYAVDILIRDTDLYVAAFRRRLNDDWGTWFRYDDQSVPSFIEAKMLGFNSDHLGSEMTTPGGHVVIDQVFMTLAKHEETIAKLDERRSTKKKAEGVSQEYLVAKERLMKAMLIVIVMFSEANRFRCIFHEIIRRIKEGEDSSELDKTMWSFINDWGHWSDKMLKLWVEHPVIPMDADLFEEKTDDQFKDDRRSRDLFVRIPNTTRTRRLTKVKDMIGPEGQLMLLKIDNDFMLKHNKDLKEKLKRKGDIRDPTFEAPTVMDPKRKKL